MEMGEDEGDDPLGHMTCDLDLNDNNPIITHCGMDHTDYVQTLRLANDEVCMTKLRSMQSSPNHVSSRSPTISDNAQQVPGHSYSPEDTLNNDFFYDDEFAVPFDATLGGMEDEILDSMDINGLLRLVGNDNQRWRSKMSASKSDSCLYQAELDFSDCSDVNRSSSERDLLTSSDMSDFKAEPLFSPPPPGGLEDSCAVLQTDSMCNEELAGSLVKDEDRYAFDWTANKDQYMISFDRSPTKISTDDIYRETTLKRKLRGMVRSSSLETSSSREMCGSLETNGRLGTRQMICWGQRSSGSSGRSSGPGSSGQGSSTSGPYSSHPSSRGPSSVCPSSSDLGSTSSSRGPSSVCPSGSELGSASSLTTMPGYLVNNSASRGSTDTSTSSTMTTWKLLRQHKGRGKLPEGMTTWQRVHESCLVNSTTHRSKSMPDLQSSRDSALHREEGPAEGAGNARPNRYSASLLEMFRQLKAQQGVLHAYCEPPLVETSPVQQFEMDNWSMSPASSHQLSPTEGTRHGITDSSLIRWNTHSGLCVENDPGAATYRDNNGKLKTGPVFNKCQSDRLKDNVSDPTPRLSDCGVQTSIENLEKCAKPNVKNTQNNKSLQTSLELLTGAHIRIHRKQLRGYPNLGGLKRPHSMGSIQQRTKSLEDDRFTVQLSHESKERMTRSLFFNSTTLPDLSFLNKQMSCSIANLTQTLHQVPNKKPLQQPPIANQVTKPPKPTTDKLPPKKCEPALFRPKKPPRQRRPLSACLGQSRDSSPVLLGIKHRSRSTDSASSFCSSSSSGIDPGSYDSHKSGHYFTEHHSRHDNHHRWLPHQEGKLIVAKGSNGNHGNNKECVWLAQEARTAKVCNICRAHYQSDGGDVMIASHPSYRKSSAEDGFSSWTSCDCSRLAYECRQVACTCVDCAPCVPCSCAYREVCGGQTLGCVECHHTYPTTRCHHHLHHSGRCHNSKPLKSCLVKRRQGNHGNQKVRAFKHRSWSDPSDGLVLKYSQEGQIRYQLITHDKECRRRQPLAELEIVDHSDKPGTLVTPTSHQVAASKPKPPCCLDYSQPKDQASNVKVMNSVTPAETRPIVVPSNSPQEIPVPPCTCGTTHAVLHSSSDSGEGDRRCTSDIYRSKKSVSFSEEVSYHSPYNTPNQSPKKHPNDTGSGVIIRHPLSRHLSPKRRPVSLPPDFRLIVRVPVAQPIPECDTPPADFIVSPPSSITVTPSTSDCSINLIHMKDLVHDMVKATQTLIKHFSDIREISQQADVTSNDESSEVGQIVLQYLCPAVYALIQDGLKSHVRSLFGKVRNTPWRVIEDSTDNALMSRSVRDLVHDLKSMDFLSTAWLKFNAFVFGLLNTKTLDVWFSHLQSNTKIVTKHYECESFLYSATTPGGRLIFLDLITVIQPLAGMTFRLKYDLEYRLLERRQRQLSDQMLSKHLAPAGDSQYESEYWFLQQKQAARLKELSASGHMSLIRGEISPVQGAKGQPQSVLHHSAPAAYHEQQVALYSPAKAHWQSLYNKVQQLKTSDIALHTKTLVTESIRSLKDSATFNTTLKLSKDALQNLGQDLVLAAVGYSSPVRSLPKVPGLTDSGDSTKQSNSSSTSTLGDNQPSHSNDAPTHGNDAPAHGMSTMKVVPMTENNELLISEEDGDEKSESFIQKVSHRLVGYNSPQRAYKQGVTEYQFDNKRNTRPSSLASSKSLDGLSKTSRHRFSKSRIPVKSKSPAERKSLFDENGMPRCASFDESIEFHIPSRAESFDSPDAPPEGHKPTPSKPRSGKLSRKLGSSLRKSWTSFGPKLVNFMDHLLLDDSKAAKKKSSVTTNAPSSSSSTSSGSSSPPSVILKTDLSKVKGRPPLKRSATVSPCESSISPTDLQQMEQAEGSEVMEVNIQTAKTASSMQAPSGDHSQVAPSGARGRVKPPGDIEEHNWFVQALCHHVAMRNKQLSYNKGTVFAVIKQVDSEWLLCRHGNKEGLVHKACVTKA